MNNWLNTIYAFPNGAVFVGVVASYLGVGYLLYIALFKKIHARYRISDESNNVIAGFMSVIGVLYGLLIGLVAVNNWDNFDAARHLCNEEAASISAFYRDIMMLNDPINESLKEDTKTYLRNIIEKDFPGYEKGDVQISSYHLLDRLHRDLVRYASPNHYNDPFYLQAIERFNKMVEFRSIRVESVINDGVPFAYWVVILLGSIVVLFLSLFFHMSSSKGHLALIHCLSFLIGIMVYLILVVDNPYRGSVSVNARPYQDVLDRVMAY